MPAARPREAGGGCGCRACINSQMSRTRARQRENGISPLRSDKSCRIYFHATARPFLLSHFIRHSSTVSPVPVRPVSPSPKLRKKCVSTWFKLGWTHFHSILAHLKTTTTAAVRSKRTIGRGDSRQCGRGRKGECGRGVRDAVVACTSGGVAGGWGCGGCERCGGIDRRVARMTPTMSRAVACAVTALQGAGLVQP